MQRYLAAPVRRWAGDINLQRVDAQGFRVEGHAKFFHEAELKDGTTHTDLPREVDPIGTSFLEEKPPPSWDSHFLRFCEQLYSLP
jgi:hypothetical protein